MLRYPLFLFIFPFFTYAQDGYVSLDNQEARWQDVSTWSKSQNWMSDTPGFNVGGYTDFVDVYGYLVANQDLSLGGSSYTTIYDTLRVLGDLTVGSGATLELASGGVMIISGNLLMSGAGLVNNGGQSVVEGNLDMDGGASIVTTDPESSIYVFGTETTSGGATINGTSATGGSHPDILSETTLSQENTPLYDFTMGTLTPITLSIFKVQKIGERVVITWRTDSEINTDYVLVLRSSGNLQTWSAIDTVYLEGDSYTPRTYQVSDAQPLPGTSYYRLRAVDYDGYIEDHPIEIITMPLSQIFRLWPNPLYGTRLQIGLPVGSYQVRLLNARGQQVYQERLAPYQKVLNIPSDLQKGVYTITFITGGLEYSKKLIING